MKHLSPKTALVFALLWSLSAFASENFPTSPDPSLTPGSKCESHEYRYPEKIPYCDRSVSSDQKAQIIDTYDTQRGFRVGTMKRAEFKIDHYIPLCMGGSNNPNNLWPQHQSVYTYTDPLEGALCDKMAKGRLLQADAIAMIKQAKAEPQMAPLIFKKAQNL